MGKLKSINRDLKGPQKELKEVLGDKRRVLKVLVSEYGWTAEALNQVRTSKSNSAVLQMAYDDMQAQRAVNEQLLDELFPDVDVDGDSEDAKLYRMLKRLN